MTFLVTGATGRTSSGVVAHLRAAGEDVRVLVRDRAKAEQAFGGDVDIVDGAFDDATVLAKAFDEIDVAFLAVGSSPDQVHLEKAMIDGAVKANGPHIVKLTSIGTSHDSAMLVGRLHAEIEDHLTASGLPHTLLRAASFTDNLFYAAPSVAAHHSWTGSAPTGRVAYIDIRDLSEAAAIVLRDPALHGRIHDLTGSGAYTYPEVAALLTGILGHEVTYVPVSEQDRRAALRAAGTPEWYVELLASLETGAESGQIGGLTTTVRDLLGRAPRTVEAFLTEHAARFTE
jgi:uncharacterized protein YbjT (DUF2867 family)